VKVRRVGDWCRVEEEKSWKEGRKEGKKSELRFDIAR